ncbi:desulfoferrodoxin [Oscillospiraceae bacterium OttesenSCG-928-F05]|nr:desulfoferrodoxin [Oscillospiraceae bacterium OttesenSCG-928-F05]
MKILECVHCKSQAMLIEEAGVPLICCGEAMREIEAGVIEAATEKHIPVVTIDAGLARVTVGEVLHPMIETHYIQWILFCQGKKVQLVKLSPEDAPEAAFSAETGEYTAYAYCNLHGLWKSGGQAT